MNLFSCDDDLNFCVVFQNLLFFSSLHIHLTQLQRQQRLLSNENEQLVSEITRKIKFYILKMNFPAVVYQVLPLFLSTLHGRI